LVTASLSQTPRAIVFRAIRRVKDAGFARAAWRLIFRRKISP
jgi:hypothetical protein